MKMLKPRHVPLALVVLALGGAPAWAADPHAGHGAMPSPMERGGTGDQEVRRDSGGQVAGSGHEGHGAAQGEDRYQGQVGHDGHGEHQGQGSATGQAPDASHDGHDGHDGHGAASGGPAPTPGMPAAGPSLPPPTPEEVRAAFPDLGPHAHMKAPLYTLALVDRLEAREVDGSQALAWDAHLAVGGDFDRLVFSSEGERLHGETEEARHELYWRHAFSRWWESRLGLRHDAGAGPGRDWAAFGIEGLAPYFIELSATAYVGDEGRSAFTLEAEYDIRLTNRLILQPRLELNAQGQADAGKGLGSGLADSELGLRLRYEIRREFAPYVGVEWSRLHGDTATLARGAGGDTGEARAVAGVRLWY